MKPSNPKLWNRVENKARATSESAPAGQWSERKAALARLAYEREGGKWDKPSKQDEMKRVASLRKLTRKRNANT